jgi:hypothetical protein
MKRQSPLFSADKIKTPLMVVQGANDPRVNKREADQIVIALRDRNYPVEYLVAPDEGHGFARPVNNSAMIMAAEKFLANHLGGRFQDSGTPEVTKRLAEITVDPKTVALAVPVSMNKAPEADLTGKWNMVVDTGDQQIDVAMDLKQTGADFGGSMTSHLGPGTVEKGKVSGTSFSGVMKAEVQGQPMEIQMEGKLDGGKLTGTLSAPGLPAMAFTATKQN